MALPFVKQGAQRTRDRAQRNLVSALESLIRDASCALKDAQRGDVPTCLSSISWAVGETLRFSSMLETINETIELANAPEPSPGEEPKT